MAQREADRLYSAPLVLCGEDEAIVDGALRVRGGRIVALGRRSDFGARPDCPETDLRQAVLAPGLVNAHAHLEYSCCEGRLKKTSFLRWLPRLIKVHRALSPTEIATGVAYGIRQIIRCGTTTVGDISTYGLSAEALRLSGLRYVCFLEVIHMGPPPYESLLRDVEDRLAGFAESSRGRAGLSPHAPYTVAQPLMKALRRRFHAGRGVPFAVHVAECRSEGRCLRSQTGLLAAMLRRAGFYSSRRGANPLATSVLDFLGTDDAENRPRDLLIHGNFLTREEVRVLADGGRSVLVVCPGTREFHGVTTPIVRRARRRGLPVALGTDSLASNDAAGQGAAPLDMWAEMRRSMRMKGDWTARDAFAAATTGGALAMGLEAEVGRLRKGYRADFIAVDLDSALARAAARDPRPETLLGAWLGCKRSPSIRGVWVDGEALRREDRDCPDWERPPK